MEGGVLKWKVGATYLDMPSSQTQDEDYEDIITHKLEFVPKKEVTQKVPPFQSIAILIFDCLSTTRRVWRVSTG